MHLSLVDEHPDALEETVNDGSCDSLLFSFFYFSSFFPFFFLLSFFLLTP